jgi:hypothetical protein
MNRYHFVCLLFLRMQPHLTTTWWRSHYRHLHLSVDDIKGLQMLSKCCPGWCGCSCVYLGLETHWNLQFGSPILHITLKKVVGCIPPPGWVNLFGLICFCQKLSMQHCTVLGTVPIMQPVSSSSLSLPSSVSCPSSSSCSPLCSVSELARSL